MKRVSLLALLLISAFAAADAQQVSESKAKAIAKSFFGGPMFKNRQSAQPELAYTSITEGNTNFYVFNDKTTDQGGFVIVGGNKVAQEILGYSLSGSFDYDRLPDNMKWWLSQYDSQISFAIQNPEKTVMPTKTRADKAVIPQMLTTKWNQGDPFNMLIPTLGSEYQPFVTGCVATAMAQVMKYHEYPTTGTGSFSYDIPYNSTFNVTFSADFGNTEYDWENMLDEYIGGQYDYTDASAVAELMYHAGVSVKMQYNSASSGGSGASSSDIPGALSQYFGYDKSAYDAKRNYYSNEEWEEMIYNELANNRPVLYGGQDVNGGGGHQFVCDGYAGDGLYHFNWGWGGYCDGNFAITGADALMPYGSGTGGAGEDAAYIGQQTACINVMPDMGNDYSYKIAANLGYRMKKGSYQEVTNFNIDGSDNQLVNINYSALNISAARYNFEIGIMLKKQEDTSDPLFYKLQEFTLNPGYYIALDGQFNTYKITEDGVYDVILVHREAGSTSDSDWKPVLLPSDDREIPTLTVTNRTGYSLDGLADNLLLSKIVVSSTEEDNDGYVTGAFLGFSYSITNVGTEAISSYPLNTIFKVGSLNVNCTGGIGYLPAGQTQTLRWDLSDFYYDGTITEGDRGEIIVYGQDATTKLGPLEYNNQPVVICNSVEYTQGWTPTGVATICLPFSSSVPNETKAYTIDGAAGNILQLTEVDYLKRLTPYFLIYQGEYDGIDKVADSDDVYIPNNIFYGPNPPAEDFQDYYQKGLLYGTLKGETGSYGDSTYELTTNDYILQYHKGEDASYFYRYQPYPGDIIRRSQTFHAFLRPSVEDPNTQLYGLAGTAGTSGIEAVKALGERKIESIYDINGSKSKSLVKGLNIIKMSDGSVIKAIVK